MAMPLKRCLRLLVRPIICLTYKLTEAYCMIMNRLSRLRFFENQHCALRLSVAAVITILALSPVHTCNNVEATSSSRTASTDFCLDRFFWVTQFLMLFFPYFSFLGRALDQAGHLVSF